MKVTNDEVSLWQQRIDAWGESGLKQSVWCRQNDVKDSQFWYWKKKLSLLTRKNSQQEEIKPPKTEPVRSAFIPVAMPPATPAFETPESLSIELP